MNGIEALSRGDLAGFAAANGWQHLETATMPASTGGEQLFQGAPHDVIRGAGWEVGRLRGGTTSSSRSGRFLGIPYASYSTQTIPLDAIDVGYLAVRLARRLPHIVLDAPGNEDLLNRLFRGRWRGDRAFDLGGEFADRFRLYVPEGYERDALYVLSPALMALLIDEAGDLDVEIRDDHLFIYQPRGWDLSDVAVWDRIGRLYATVGTLTWDQTDGYYDDRLDARVRELVPLGDVAEPGRRVGPRMRSPLALKLTIALGVGFLLIALLGERLMRMLIGI
ncbi:hypothetical protein [Demequina gelatinilytica]|uniref:hypothetical protein n=1 Tax=Demequina gelatinilytica TaxID=1638980 RepID=UPI0007818B74|nr:hypothetical protein [Demequina gelatinilytica]